jgi:dihydroorotate dehydrogenase
MPQDEALINRFGFNSAGAAGVAANLTAGAQPRRLRLGINLGKNKDTPNERAADDYLAVLEQLHAHADYVVVNVSSPNTVGLRDLQQGGHLRQLVAQVVARARTLSGSRNLPVLVKLSPDMDDRELLEAVDASLEGGAAGLIATNTTLSRSGLSASTTEPGGLSGRPLRARATSVCRAIFTHTNGRVPIVGVGGIDSPDAAYERIRAGATLVQLYTGLIFQGPGLVGEIVRGLPRLLERDRIRSLHEAVGIDAR